MMILLRSFCGTLCADVGADLCAAGTIAGRRAVDKGEGV
jgi:hypothetical protein